MEHSNNNEEVCNDDGLDEVKSIVSTDIANNDGKEEQTFDVKVLYQKTKEAIKQRIIKKLTIWQNQTEPQMSLRIRYTCISIQGDTTEIVKDAVQEICTVYSTPEYSLSATIATVTTLTVTFSIKKKNV